jgi:hypothetical protein
VIIREEFLVSCRGAHAYERVFTDSGQTIGFRCMLCGRVYRGKLRACGTCGLILFAGVVRARFCSKECRHPKKEKTDASALV